MNKNKLILLISILGLLFTGYMTYLHYTSGVGFCLTGGNECAEIVQGIYSELLGIPVSLIGFLLFFSLGFLSFMSKEESVDKKIFWFSLVGVFGAGYFNYIMLFKLGSLCPWCELSHLSYLIIFFLSSANLKKFLTYTIIVLLLGIFVSWIANASGQHDELAKCLTAKNVTFYGAFWCPHCNDQKALLGRSMQYINYVECSLPNKDQNAYCDKQGIEYYPTWDINGEKISEVFTPEELAVKSGCEDK